MRRTPIPPLAIVPRRRTYLPHLLAVAVLWLAAMALDYHDQMQAANARAADMTAQMAACLRGEWRGRAEDGTEVACWPAEVNHYPARKPAS